MSADNLEIFYFEAISLAQGHVNSNEKIKRAVPPMQILLYFFRRLHVAEFLELTAHLVAVSKVRDRPPELRLRHQNFIEASANQLDLQLLRDFKVAHDGNHRELAQLYLRRQAGNF